MPTEVYFGRGVLAELPKILKKRKVSKTLFIVGKHTQNDLILNKLLNLGQVYPKEIKKSGFDEIDKLADYLRKGDYDNIVAIGGGTIIDTAKSGNILASNNGEVKKYVSSKKVLRKKGLFLVAVPTTSGTGSEVTSTAVVWGVKKYSLQSDFIFPDVAIVDSALTDNCPRYVTATSGIDALCQAIEAYWNLHHNPTSDKYALESIKTIIGNLEKAVTKPNKESRDKMAWGSLFGGLAFSNTQTTICHSVSYPISIHWNVPHGQATSITLPSFIEYTFDVLGDREKLILEAISVSDKKSAAQKIRNLMKSIGLKTKLSELGIQKKEIDLIVAEGFDPIRAKNSPRIPTKEKLRKMLLSIL